MKIRLIPREESFFDLFEAQGRTLQETALKVQHVFTFPESAPETHPGIVEREHRGDEITHEIMDRLTRTFVTPLDQEDIHDLAVQTDDILDFMEDAAAAILLFKIEHTTSYARELASILVQIVGEVANLLSRLRSPKDFKTEHIRLHDLENNADRVYREALVNLFENTESAVDIIKWKEIYDHLERAIDRCEDVADTIRGVIIKYS
ncbi:MAG: DUF47 domain-containing protein [Chloroflexi bacterium]|nr:DUF47 domain-containing protein [Chloroflexota bacterium]